MTPFGTAFLSQYGPFVVTVMKMRDDGDFLCRFDDGNEKIIDLRVSADFPNDFDFVTLIGKRVSFAYAHSYVAIAGGVKVLEEHDET